MGPVVFAILFPCGFGFSAAESMTKLKMIDRKVPKEIITRMEIPMIPVKVFLTLFLTRFTVGPRPMNVWLAGYPFRLVFCLAMVLLVFITPNFELEEGGFPPHYYAMVIIILALNRVGIYAMFVAIMAFFARISDPAVGGTYMTFLNTITNLGGNWPATLALWWVDVLTYKQCDISSLNTKNTNLTQSQLNDLNSNDCQDKEQT